jgi:hypothetical protein
MAVSVDPPELDQVESDEDNDKHQTKDCKENREDRLCETLNKISRDGRANHESLACRSGMRGGRLERCTIVNGSITTAL